MKLIFLTALFTIIFQLASSNAIHFDEHFASSLWKQFKLEYVKEYITDEVEQARYEIFKQNVADIDKHNVEHALGLYTFALGINHFADWTKQEFREYLTGYRPNVTKLHAESTTTFLRLPSEVEIPDSIDWREKGAVTEVKNQGQCGSWAFSTTGSLEGAHFRANGTLVSLSEQQLVDCSGKYDNQGCNGGLMDNAFKYVKENGGLDTEESYSYHARQSKCHFKPQNVGATCTGFVDVSSGDEQALKEAVATVGPVSVAIDATEDKFMFYKNGVFVDKTCGNKDNQLDHGVLVVGYGSAQTVDSTADYWIVKNSWGPSWGEQGYIRMARNHDNMCGISTAASYPLVK